MSRRNPNAEALLWSLARASQLFMASDSLDATVRQMLADLGSTLDVSRVYIFQNRQEGERLLVDQCWEWAAPGVRPEIDNPDLTALDYADERFAMLPPCMEAGEAVLWNVPELPRALAEFLADQDIVSLVLVPIHVAGRWWGFLGCDECRSLREWHPVEVEVLRTAAAIFAAAWERHRVEAELRDREESYRELVENSGDAIWSMDFSGKFLTINRAAEALFRLPASEVIGRHWKEFIPDLKDRAKVEAAIKAKLSGEQSEAQYQVEVVRKSGERVPVEIRSRLIFREGQPVAIQGTARDIAERQRLEEQLLQASKMEAVVRLAGGVAHDFNNILTLIRGYCERLLGRYRPGDAVHSELMEILKASERAADLVEELQSFARGQPAELRPLDLNLLIEKLVPMLRRVVGEEVALFNLADGQVGKIRADPGLLEQVLINLLVNARDAMPGGGRVEIVTAPALAQELRARGGREPLQPRYVRLSVHDSGVGIPPEVLEHIFEPFFTTKAPGKGTGLGLSTVYGIVNQLNGWVFVDSTPGQGTVFHLYFPEVEPPRRFERAPAETASVSSAPTILVADDEDLIRELAVQILSGCGYRVLEAGSASEALALVVEQKEPVDLLLTDVVMPGMTGADLAERLRRERPQLRVLFMSGYSDSLIFRYGGNLAAVKFLQKPFSAEALERKVREVLAS